MDALIAEFLLSTYPNTAEGLLAFLNEHPILMPGSARVTVFTDKEIAYTATLRGAVHVVTIEGVIEV